VLALLVITSASAHGVAAALAGLTKFAPLALAPLFLRGVGEWPRRRAIASYVLAFGLTIAVTMLVVLVHDNLHAFWHDTIAYQASRTTPFSVWGLWGRLGFEQHLVEGAAVALALAVAFVPGRRGVVEVAALAAAVLIALQLSADYWLYSYIVWFFPALLVALLGAFPARRSALAMYPAAPARAAARSPQPASALSR